MVFSRLSVFQISCSMPLNLLWSNGIIKILSSFTRLLFRVFPSRKLRLRMEITTTQQEKNLQKNPSSKRTGITTLPPPEQKNRQKNPSSKRTEITTLLPQQEKNLRKNPISKTMEITTPPPQQHPQKRPSSKRMEKVISPPPRQHWQKRSVSR